jgi:hypothetical protein
MTEADIEIILERAKERLIASASTNDLESAKYRLYLICNLVQGVAPCQRDKLNFKLRLARNDPQASPVQGDLERKN